MVSIEELVLCKVSIPVFAMCVVLLALLVDTIQRGLAQEPLIAVIILSVSAVIGRAWYSLASTESGRVLLWCGIGLMAVAALGMFGYMIFGNFGYKDDHAPQPGAARAQYQYQPPPRHPQTVVPRIQPIPPPKSVSLSRQTTMYHATPDLNNAYDIFKYLRFRVGSSTPTGFYLSPDFWDVAEDFGNRTGAVVEFYVAPQVKLREKGTTLGYFYYYTPDTNVGDYENLPAGIIPVRILDCNGNTLL